MSCEYVRERAWELLERTKHVVDDLEERRARRLAGQEPVGWTLPPPAPAPSPVLPPVVTKAAPTMAPVTMAPAQAKQWEAWLAKRLKHQRNLIADGMGIALAQVQKELRAEIAANADAHRAEQARMLVRIMNAEQRAGGWPVSSLNQRGRANVAA
jgi:hypothetical protein